MKKAKGIKRKWETKAGGNGGKKKRFGDKKKREEANEGEEMDDDDDEHIVFTTQVAGSSRISLDPSEEGINFDEPDVIPMNSMNDLSFITGSLTVQRPHTFAINVRPL